MEIDQPSPLYCCVLGAEKILKIILIIMMLIIILIKVKFVEKFWQLSIKKYHSIVSISFSFIFSLKIIAKLFMCFPYKFNNPLT